MKIKIRSHGFFCFPENVSEVRMLTRYCEELTQYEEVYNARTKKSSMEAKAVFATIKDDRSEYGFLLSELNRLQVHLRRSGLSEKDMDTQTFRAPGGASRDFDGSTMFQPRGEQPEALEFALSPNQPVRVLNAATGVGKTFLAFKTMDHFNTLTAAVMGGAHINTWVQCAEEYMGMRSGEVLVIKGSASLKAIMNLALTKELNAKMLIISSTTMRNYITAYETDPVFDYPVKPHQLWETLGVGLKLVDECHEQIHSTIKQIIYSHVPITLYLSATLVSDDQFINKMIDAAYPKRDNWRSKENKHIAVRPVFYFMDKNSKLMKGFKFKGPRGYSHNLYESSIIKKPKLLKQYLGFVGQLVRSTYIKNHKPGLKCLVIASSIAMCEHIRDYLKDMHPDFTVGLFIGGSKKEELYERDIIVGGPSTCGTGIDVPNLIVNLLTISLSSVQLSRQIMGRTRPVKKYPEITPMFMYMNNVGIPQHMAYHRKRVEDLKSRSKDIKEIRTNFKLGSDLNIR